jgi:peptide/nickel transport system permease protein
VITYVVRRLAYSIPVLLAASVLIFFSMSAIGDPLAQLRVNPLLSETTVERIKERKHLDESLPVQYGHWVNDVVTNQFGSPLLQPGNRIWDDLQRVVPHTLQLIVLAEIIALLFGVAIGVYAVRQYSLFDYAATTFSFLDFAMPVFWRGRAGARTVRDTLAGCG